MSDELFRGHLASAQIETSLHVLSHELCSLDVVGLRVVEAHWLALSQPLQALERLDGFDPEMARAVEMRFFGGLSAEETTDFLGIPLRTFERRWKAARAWLRAKIG